MTVLTNFFSNMKKARILYVTVSLSMVFARFASLNAHPVKAVRYVVSPVKDSEDFYLELNRLTGAKGVNLNIGRKEICRAIFKSQSIPPHNNVDIIDEPIEELKIYPGLFRAKNDDWHLFEKSSYELWVNVSVLQTVREEAVFPCMVKVKKTEALKLYLVSGLYDFNRGIRSLIRTHPAHGRFVFAYNESSNLASLVAIAEYPAEAFSLPPRMIEDVKNNSAALSERSRAICDFTTPRKLRICAIALNAEVLALTFLPLENRIEEQCENITATFQPLSRPTAAPIETGVWAIVCKAEPRIGREILQTYHVSLGLEPHQFFIYDPYFSTKFMFYSRLAEHVSV